MKKNLFELEIGLIKKSLNEFKNNYLTYFMLASVLFIPLLLFFIAFVDAELLTALDKFNNNEVENFDPKKGLFGNFNESEVVNIQIYACIFFLNVVFNIILQGAVIVIQKMKIDNEEISWQKIIQNYKSVIFIFIKNYLFFTLIFSGFYIVGSIFASPVILAFKGTEYIINLLFVALISVFAYTLFGLMPTISIFLKTKVIDSAKISLKLVNGYKKTSAIIFGFVILSLIVFDLIIKFFVGNIYENISETYLSLISNIVFMPILGSFFFIIQVWLFYHLWQIKSKDNIK